MSTTNSYLSSGARARSLTTESNFAGGMKWTDTPLTEGYSKLLINYALADNGNTLQPRAGLKMLSDTNGLLTMPSSSDVCTVHHVSTSNVFEPEDVDSSVYRYVLWGRRAEFNGEVVLDLTHSAMAVQTGDDTFIHALTITHNTQTMPYSGECYLTTIPNCKKIHGIDVNGERSGNFVNLDNTTYVMFVGVQGTSVYRTLAYIKINWTSAAHTAVTFQVVPVTPNDISATQAVNYGYNMLKAEPYSFTNKQSEYATLILQGIVPHDAQGNVISTARLGNEIYFDLVYNYPKAHAQNNKKYIVEWSIQDVAKDNVVTVQSLSQSQVYTPGDTIRIRTTQTSYKQFVLTATVYDKSDVDSYKSDNSSATDIEVTLNVTPLGTMTLAFYYLTGDKNTSQQNLNPVKYDLTTATGMAAWQHRLVLWGCQNCKNTLWVSEVNDPSYFPYPNQIETFDSDIVFCVKYKMSLLVFTQTGIYQLDFEDDGITYNVKCVQERISMTTEEAASIIPVGNLVAFKNNNYYYMIVPASIESSQYGNLILAPISKPITEMMDNFSEFISYILRLYLNEDLEWSLVDWNSYLEQNYLRYVYKLKVDLQYYDLVLQYDSTLRTWTTQIYESNKSRMVQFYPSVTNDSIFVVPQDVGANNTYVLNFLKADPNDPEDDYYLDGGEHTQGAFQYIDTGYRVLNNFENINKKWRQIQFQLANKDSAHLDFYTEFRVDNEFRKMLYSYETDVVDGVETIIPVLEDADEAKGLDDTLDWCSTWGVDPNKFPDTPIARVKLGVNGKGRYARFRLASRNTHMYELSNISYVFRVMTAR